MATTDHGLEVLRKAALEYAGPNELQIRTLVTGGSISTGPFSPPSNTDYIGRSVLSNVETFVFKQGGSGGTLLKTITVTYTNNKLTDLVSVSVA